MDYSIESKKVGNPFTKTVDESEERLSGYDIAYSQTGQPTLFHKITYKEKFKPYSQPKYTRNDAIRRHLKAAQESALQMETFAEHGDLMELSNSGFSLRAALQELWKLRNEREDDWGDLINLLQGALAQEEFERFTVEQCQALRNIIVDHLTPAGTDVDDIESTVLLLRKAGFDPWKGISGSLDITFDQDE